MSVSFKLYERTQVLVAAIGGATYLYDAASDRWLQLTKDHPARCHPLVLQCSLEL